MHSALTTRISAAKVRTASAVLASNAKSSDAAKRTAATSAACLPTCGPSQYRSRGPRRRPILFPAHKIENFLRNGIVKHSVDREIATLRVLFGRAEGDVVRTSAVGVGALGAKRGDFHIAGLFRADDDDYTETRSNLQGATSGKKFANTLGMRVGGHVVVLRDSPHQKIAHATARPQSAKSGLLKSSHDLDGKISLWISGQHSVSACLGSDWRASGG